MKQQLLPSFLLFMLVAAAGGIISGCPVGGDCEYKDGEGIITIKNIRRSSEGSSAPESSDDKFSISYTFNPDDEASSSSDTISEEMLLTREKIDRQEIKIGKQFRTQGKYLTRGSCYPGDDLKDVDKWR